jgi:hypothetical protein
VNWLEQLKKTGRDGPEPNPPKPKVKPSWSSFKKTPRASARSPDTAQQTEHNSEVGQNLLPHLHELVSSGSSSKNMNIYDNQWELLVNSHWLKVYWRENNIHWNLIGQQRKHGNGSDWFTNWTNDWKGLHSWF